MSNKEVCTLDESHVSSPFKFTVEKRECYGKTEAVKRLSFEGYTTKEIRAALVEAIVKLAD